MMKMVTRYLIFKVELNYSDIFNAYLLRYAIFGRSSDKTGCNIIASEKVIIKGNK